MTKNREGLVNTIVHRDYYEEGVVIDAFYRLGITEKIGSGIAMMREAMAERGIEITFDTEDFFIATLTRPETAQKEVTPQVTSYVKDLLLLCKQPMGRNDLQKKLDLKDREHFRKTYLLPALNAGLIERTIPDKPKSRLQKYILTSKGRKWLGKKLG